MGDGSHKKRKRIEEPAEVNSEQPPAKIRSTEQDGSKHDKKSTKDAGKARQIKSERKSKKVLNQSKQGAEPQSLATDSTDKADEFADGGNFVALLDSTGGAKARSKAAVPNDDSTANQEKKSAKKSSPRAIRKAAKSADAAVAKYGRKVVEGQDAQSALETKSTGDAGDTSAATSGTPARFICFVGNLPFTATTDQIQAHFSKLAPKSIRHSTDKATGKSKGFAFLEFESYDRMKTCLKVYHHSIFDPARTALNGGEVIQETEETKKIQGRRLNVELTAGGGGNTKGRRDKIREKNSKLKEERARRKLEEKKELQDKVRKRREQSEKEKAKRSKKGPTGANAEAMRDERGVHPSRLNRVPQAV